MGRRKDTVQRTVRTRRMLYFICEGFTEKLYFENFGRVYRDVGRIDVVFPYEKETFDRGQTDRMQLVRMMEGEMALRIFGQYTPYMFVTKCLHRHLDGSIGSMGSRPDRVWRAINDVRDSVLRRIGSEYVDGSGFVTDYEPIEDAIKVEVGSNPILSGYCGLFDVDYPDLRCPEVRTSVPEVDRYFVVFDRDWDAFNPRYNTESQYREVFGRCDELGYRVLMSTPLFEFWLLMHHEDAQINGYGYDLSQKRTILEDLSDLERGLCDDWDDDPGMVKGISGERMEAFYDAKGFETAVRMSKKLTVDLEGLLRNAGTNIGVELEQLIG